MPKTRNVEEGVETPAAAEDDDDDSTVESIIGRVYSYQLCMHEYKACHSLERNLKNKNLVKFIAKILYLSARIPQDNSTFAQHCQSAQKSLLLLLLKEHLKELFGLTDR